MAVQKIDYSLNPPWTYDQLLAKYFEILGTLGVYGTLIDTYEYNSFNHYVYKRTHQPSESPAAKYPDCYVDTWIQDGACNRQMYFTADGSWDTDTHRFVQGTDPDEGSYKTYYSLSSSNRYSYTYSRQFWNMTANLNEKLPIYLYRSTEDPNFWWIAMDNGSAGEALYEPSSSVQFDPMVAIDRRYCFPMYRIYGSGEQQIRIRDNGQAFGESWAQKGSGSSNYDWFGQGVAGDGDLDEHGFNSVTSTEKNTTNCLFSMPNIYGGGDYSSGATRLTLVRGAKWTNWLKNKLIPNDFALLADPSITSQTRVGQPYIINGKTYEVVKASTDTDHGMFLVAQITD